MTYSEKLKDPRWQKLRLQILDRDLWSCINCQATEITLHVHHLVYTKGAEPWDYPPEELVTLCETCHRAEFEGRPGAEAEFLRTIRQKGFMVDDIVRISRSFQKLKIINATEVTASMIEFMFSAEGMMDIEPLFWNYSQKRSARSGRHRE
jgi:hypothetical protein